MEEEGVNTHGVNLQEEEQKGPDVAGKRSREEQSKMKAKGIRNGRYGGQQEEVVPRAKRETRSDMGVIRNVYWI